ncbi:MAG: hypothetical protein II488_06100, partial [Firmicutes bacterium]|nr:hypothetical protein [Bacillota bacterium]
DWLIAYTLACCALGRSDFDPPRGARNFANGMTSIDMEHLRLVEKSADTAITISERTAGAVTEAVRKVLGF